MTTTYRVGSSYLRLIGNFTITMTILERRGNSYLCETAYIPPVGGWETPLGHLLRTEPKQSWVTRSVLQSVDWIRV
jgi:hypothetical protein